MYFLIYHVQPRPDLDDAEHIVRAYVSCWIEANSLRNADLICGEEIGDLKWDILERDEAYEIDDNMYSPDYDGFEFFQQAKIDKSVLRFHTYPVE